MDRQRTMQDAQYRAYPSQSGHPRPALSKAGQYYPGRFIALRPNNEASWATRILNASISQLQPGTCPITISAADIISTPRDVLTKSPREHPCQPLLCILLFTRDLSCALPFVEWRQRPNTNCKVIPMSAQRFELFTKLRVSRLRFTLSPA